MIFSMSSIIYNQVCFFDDTGSLCAPWLFRSDRGLTAFKNLAPENQSQTGGEQAILITAWPLFPNTKTRKNIPEQILYRNFSGNLTQRSLREAKFFS